MVAQRRPDRACAVLSALVTTILLLFSSFAYESFLSSLWRVSNGDLLRLISFHPTCFGSLSRSYLQVLHTTSFPKVRTRHQGEIVKIARGIERFINSRVGYDCVVRCAHNRNCIMLLRIQIGDIEANGQNNELEFAVLISSIFAFIHKLLLTLHNRHRAPSRRRSPITSRSHCASFTQLTALLSNFAPVAKGVTAVARPSPSVSNTNTSP